MFVFHSVAENVKTFAHSYVFDRYVVRKIEVDRSEIPYALYPESDQSVRDIRRDAFLRGDDRYVTTVFFDIIGQLLHIVNGYAADLLIPYLDIEQRADDKAFACEILVPGKRSAYIACADDYHIVFSVQSEYFRKILFKICDVVAVTVLTETAEIAEVLSDLRRGYAEELREFTRRNFRDAFLFKVFEITVIARQTIINILYFI